MARYTATLDTPRERYDVAAYLSDFSTTQEWDPGVVVHAMHPGWADTPGVRSSLPTFYRLTRPLLRTPEQGADTIVWLAAAAEPGCSTGGFWHDRRRRPTHRLPWTRESAADREALWTACERLTSDNGETT